MQDKLNDEEIIRGLKQGNPSVQAEFVNTFGPCLEVFIRRRFTSSQQDIEEIVQDTLYKVIIGIQTFQRKGAKFSTWVFEIAKNAALDWRKKHADRQDLIQDDGMGDDPVTQQEESKESSERQTLVRQAMSSLDPTDRQILEYYSHDVKLVDIAKYMGMEEGTVRQRKRRAMGKLEDILKGYGEKALLSRG